MGKLKIVIVDDHPIFRQGVIDAFSLEEQFDVVGQAADGLHGLDMIRALKPDVAVVDVNLPSLNGQQITRQVWTEKMNTRVLLLTAYDDAQQAIHAIHAGAAAYCAKDILPEDLIEIVRLVAGGKYVIRQEVMDGDGLANWMAEHTDQAMRSYSDPGEPFHPLSTREMEVLECVTTGLSNKEIATLLGISHQTVKNHMTAILRKLGVEDRTQAAVYALKRGWVRLYDKDTNSQE